MATMLVSVDRYLCTSYPDGDREYVDGEIVERNGGEIDLGDFAITYFSVPCEPLPQLLGGSGGEGTGKVEPLSGSRCHARGGPAAGGQDHHSPATPGHRGFIARRPGGRGARQN